MWGSCCRFWQRAQHIGESRETYPKGRANCLCLPLDVLTLSLFLREEGEEPDGPCILLEADERREENNNKRAE